MKAIAFVASTDLAAATAFYGGVLGLPELGASNPYSADFDCGGTLLRVTLVEEASVAPYTILGFDVPDVAAALASLAVEPLRYEGFGQDDAGIWTAPSGARIVWFHDPEGHVLSLTEFPVS